MSSQNFNSIPRDDFHNAVVKYYIYNSLNWKKGNRQIGIQVYEIIKKDDWDLHLSSMYDPTGLNLTKFHFTLRRGPGKGTDAFAWYKIIGLNKAAKLSGRENAGEIQLFSDANMPLEIKEEVDRIDAHATRIFALALSYIKI